MLITPAYAQAAAGGDANSMLMSLLPFALIFVIMYFLILRPQQKKVKDHQELVKNIRRGDTVVTSGGLVEFKAGIDWHLAGPYSLRGSVGYHVDSATANNGSFRFERFPFELLGFWSASNNFRLGGGMRQATSARTSGSGDGTSYATVHVAGAAAMWLRKHAVQLAVWREEAHGLRRDHVPLRRDEGFADATDPKSAMESFHRLTEIASQTGAEMIYGHEPTQWPVLPKAPSRW